MKKKYLLSAVLLSTLTYNTWAQVPDGASPNMVPNPSFEEVQGKRDGDDVDGSAAFKNNTVGWKSPSKTTPDLKIVLPQEVAKANKEGRYIDAPHSGYMMVGILTDNPKTERTDVYREYVQIKLDRPTRKGQEYYFEFWACRGKRSGTVSNNLGIMLSPAFIYRDSWDPIEMKSESPDYNMDDIINPDKPEWVRISGTFVAQQRCDFLIIGNFFGPDNTTIVKPSDGGGDFNETYYLIDDVALHELNYLEEPPVVEAIPEPVNELVEEVEIEVGAKINLDKVFFETAKWGLLPESFEQLDKVVELMNQYPDMKIEIHGHTDSRGSKSDNQELSENRTRSVYEYLTEQGIDAERMGYVGFGELQPIADNETSEGRQLNRRVEFVITDVGADNVDVEYTDDVTPYTDND